MKLRNRKSIGSFLIVAAAIAVASCDLSVAPGSFYSISKLLLPSPGVVVGDTMRDSTGAVAPLRVLAFNMTGDSVAGTTPYYIALDTFAHLVGGQYVVGNHVGATRIVGGMSNVQTLPESIKVTLSPDTIVAADSAHHLKTYSILSDSIVNSAEIAAMVQHRVGATTSPVDAVIVKYSIVSSPPSKNALPTVLIMNGNVQSLKDTSVAGRAGRSLRLYVSRLTSANQDSAVVLATASYRGVSIGTVQFTVVFKGQ